MVTLNTACLDKLRWWITNLGRVNGCPIRSTPLLLCRFLRAAILLLCKVFQIASSSLLNICLPTFADIFASPWSLAEGMIKLVALCCRSVHPPPKLSVRQEQPEALNTTLPLQCTQIV